MAGTWITAGWSNLVGRRRGPGSQLAAQWLDVPNVDIPVLQVVEEAEDALCSQHLAI